MAALKIASGSIVLLLIFFVASISTENPNPNGSLVTFQKEAERAIGKRVRIERNVSGVPGGQTICESNPVEIRIGPEFGREIQDLILAHELGHVILCSRNVRVQVTVLNVPANLRPVLDSIGTVVGNCYIDPLADQEAEHRGFQFDAIYAVTDQQNSSWMWQPPPNDYGRDYVALTIYCAELRRHTSLPVEKIIPRSEMDVLQSLKQGLGMPTCKDDLSCYILTKKLRDQFLWSKWLPMINPRNHKKE
jgi:hypothetical protein